LGNVKIYTKLLLSFLLIALLGAIPLLVNWSGTNHVQKNIRSMGDNLERIQSVMVINDLLKSIMGSQLSLLAPDLPFLVRQQIYTDVEGQVGRLRLEINHYESMTEAGYDQDLLKQLHSQFLDWQNDSDHYLKLSKELDSTDILNPLKFQNTLLQYKEYTYEWVIALSDSITNEAPFRGATTSAESSFGKWLFSLHSNNANLAVAIGKARKPLNQLFFSARKINTLILSDQEEVFELLNAVFESETMPAKVALFKALDSMSGEADRATALYNEMGTLANHMSLAFVGINTSLEGLIQINRDEAAEIVTVSHGQVRKNKYIFWIALPLGIVLSILLSLFLARKITRPIVDFNNIIKRFIDENDFSVQAVESGNDEMAQVARSFNEMVGQLKFYYDELQEKNKDLHLTQEKLEEANLELEQHSRTLEQKVEERTGELSEQKEKMEELNTKLVHINDQLASEVKKHQETHEELKKARDIAQAADQTKSSFLANMSHEIRTPLNAVIGLTSLALKQETSEKVHGYLHTVKRSARSLLGIIEDILDFSKIEAGKLEMENINFSLRDVVADLYEILHQKAEDKGLDFRCHVQDDIPDLLIGDPLRLGQVLMNLTGNSLKFTDDGEVRLSVTCESNTDTEVILKFSVADTGTGIPKEKMDGLFDPFSQVDESISRTYGGTGLGLSISKKIVQQFKGEIWVESETGLGSVFHFTVKLGKQANQNPVSQELGIHFAGYRVLIIDDNKMFRHFMAKMFTSVYFEVETATGGREGLERLRDMQSLGALPHVVLLDQSMPGMDGFELVQILNDNPAFAEIPVVMISASGQNVILRKRAETLGVRAVLTKPVKRKLLFSTIETILGKTWKLPEKQIVQEAASRSDVLKGLTILLVEDNSINRQVAYEVLVSGGALVDVAVDGVEALEMMDEKYDAVLMDIQMPRMDGLEATTRIRENSEFDDIVIIAMTARAMKGDREKCLVVGMTDYVSKPIEPEMLYSVLVASVGKQKRDFGDAEILPLDISEVPGINYEKVMRLLNHNETLFRSLLAEFLDDNQDVISEIRHLFEIGEAEQAVRVAHTLKGVAGNLGADGIQALALAIEQGLRKSMLSESRLGELEDKLHELFEGIRALSSVEPKLSGEISPLPDHEILATVLAELSRHIQANTPNAEKYLNALPLYDDVLYLKYRARILSFLEQFDFESARVVLVKMAAELGVSV
jgi:signal transduction histidine kinase/DNA-binding response OmpR family regulator